MVHIFYIGLAIISMPLLAGGDVAQPKSYNLEQFLNASERELLAHKRKLDELEQQGKLNITPSQAQLFYPNPIENRKKFELSMQSRKSLIDPRWYTSDIASTLLSPGQMSALNKAMTEDEKIHAKGGTAVYHSTLPEAYAQSYIRTKAEDLVRELQGQPPVPSKWLMLRNWRQNLATEKEKRKEYLTSGTPGWDASKNEAANLMSCSVGLPSGSRGGESALFWWRQKESSTITNPPPIHISGQYGPELENIASEVYGEVNNLTNAIETGVLLQMAVKDKRMLNKLMYPSWPHGRRRRPIVYTGKSKHTLETSKEHIDVMMRTPSKLYAPTLSIPELDEPQTRVVLTGDLMLDPTNPKIRENVAFNAYADNQEALDRFHTNVDTYFEKQKNRIKADYQMRYNKMNLPQKFWHNLQTRLCTPSSYAERRMLRKEGGNLFIRGNTFSGE